MPRLSSLVRTLYGASAPSAQPNAGVVVGFVANTGRLSDLITGEEREDASPDQPRPLPTHAYLRASDGSWSVEAVVPRVRALPALGYGTAANVREYSILLDDAAYAIVSQQAQQALGRRYGILSTFFCWLYMETHVPIHESWIPWRMCSELTTILLRAAGVPVCPGLDPQDISPAHLEAWVMSYSGAQHLR